ncbi:hypothetical protein ABPG75_003363 [Micractinium tetrahymenae]
MDTLREAVKACRSGPGLVEALEGAGVAGGPIPGLIADCLNERAGAAAAGAPAVAPANGVAAPAAAAAAAPPGERASLDSALCVIDGLMFLSPRGKQQLALFKHCLMVKTAKADISVPWSAIQHVAIIDQIPGDTKGKVLLYLHLDSEAKVMNGKTHLAAVVIQTTGEAQLDVAHPQGPPGSRLRGPAPVVLCQALGVVPGGPAPASFVSPDPQYFQSAAAAAGVKAHVKAREGFLYPLPSALCFLEAPQLFIPHSRIASIELMRAGGTSSTFDLVVHLRGGHTQEFGMLSRSEVGGIEVYIRKCRLALGAAPDSEEEEEADEGGAEAGAEQEDSDDPEDEDFNPSSSSDEEEEGEGGQQRSGGSGGTKRKRAEGGEAGEGGEEEEEEDDESEEGGSEEESSDEDDEDDGSVELVSEDEFSTGQLRSVIASESSGGRRAKRQRGEPGGSGS